MSYVVGYKVILGMLDINMINKIIINQVIEDGTLVESICSCGISHYLFFATTGELFLQGEELQENADLVCQGCTKLALSAQTLDTAKRSYLLGKNAILGRFFEQYGIPAVCFSVEVSLAQREFKKSFISKIPKFFNSLKDKIKKSPAFIIKFVRDLNTKNLEEK